MLHQPPKNCHEAVTAEGDQVFHNRYYTADCAVARYLGTDVEAEIREYSEAHRHYKERISQVRGMQRFIDLLRYIMSGRKDQYRELCRSVAYRCKAYFNVLMLKMNCCGSMVFDHNNEKLVIASVSPDRGRPAGPGGGGAATERRG